MLYYEGEGVVVFLFFCNIVAHQHEYLWLLAVRTEEMPICVTISLFLCAITLGTYSNEVVGMLHHSKSSAEWSEGKRTRMGLPPTGFCRWKIITSQFYAHTRGTTNQRHIHPHMKICSILQSPYWRGYVVFMATDEVLLCCCSFLLLQYLFSNQHTFHRIVHYHEKQ